MSIWTSAAGVAALASLLMLQERSSDAAGVPSGTGRTAADGGQAAVSSEVDVRQLASLEFPWGMAYLPDGRLLITEKPGRLRLFANGRLSAIENVPAVSYREAQTEQGGLLDVAVDPDFAQNRRIYLAYSEETPQTNPPSATDDRRFGGYLDLKDNRLRGGVVARATLNGARLDDVQVIWRQEPKTIGRGHFGHRMVFGRDGTLFITSGERMRFDPAQDPASTLGKIVRLNRDGSAPKDNPLAGRDAARPEIWSLGHRNILAVAVHPTTGQLWAFEMGPLGGDELNVITPGRNYGWPVVSEGSHYDKSPIPNHSTRQEFEAPARTWTPVISPSGALFYEGSLFPWKGNVIVGGLSSMALVRLTVDGARVVREDRIPMGRRIRDVIQAPDGALLVITDEKSGALLRVAPAADRRGSGDAGRAR